MTDWNKRFLELAKHISQWSKDPSTKCGAVIVRPDKTIASMGFNGLPRRIPDLPAILENREQKYQRIIHSEMNALLFLREKAIGYHMFVHPMMPCSRCAVHIIQAGIASVTALYTDNPRWRESIDIARELFIDGGVEYHEINWEFASNTSPAPQD